MQKALFPLVLTPFLLACQPEPSSANNGQRDTSLRTDDVEQSGSTGDSGMSGSVDVDPVVYDLLEGGVWRGNAMSETRNNFIDDSDESYEIAYTDVDGADYSHSMIGHVRVAAGDTDFFMIRLSYRRDGEEFDRRDVLVDTATCAVESRGDVTASASMPMADDPSVIDLEFALDGPSSNFVRIYVYPGAGVEFPQYSVAGTGALSISEATLEIVPR